MTLWTMTHLAKILHDTGLTTTREINLHIEQYEAQYVTYFRVHTEKLSNAKNRDIRPIHHHFNRHFLDAPD